MLGSDGHACPFTVRAPDGTAIAVWGGGDGPPVVLVHGSLRAHTIFDPLVAALRPSMTTYAIDRRGFGDSGDASSYHIDREFDDVATVVDHVAARTGSPVTLFGHSYGAGCAMGAAARTANVAHLVVYEPGLAISYPAAWIAANERALAAGDREAVIHAVLTDILEMPDKEVQTRRATPQWAEYLRAADTVLREARTESDWIYQAGVFARVKAQTLVLIGTETAPALIRSTLWAVAALPEAQVGVLAGHGHLACVTDPALVAERIRAFTGHKQPLR
ncbi:MAG: alpha/beta fold hydrolase [Vicinamibacterales bacterium]